MTPAEVAFRAARAVQVRAERMRARGAAAAPLPSSTGSMEPWIAVPPTAHAARYVEAAERIVHGHLDIFALSGVDLGQPPRWNRDPKTGIQAPLTFGKTLDYRDPDLVGDIKYLWEPNRHLHLVTLAQAHALSGEERYVREIVEHLESWFIACPRGMGPNWASALEAGMRLISWSLTWQLLPSVRIGADLKQRWLRSIYEHAEFVRGFFSLYSSANNHLIGEAAGLFIAGLTWPCWPRAAEWADIGQRVLEREALAQNAPDGVNREQAVAYQRFVLEFLVLCLLAGRANGRRFSADCEARIEAMLDYLASIMDAGGHVPQFGDADDGYAYRLSQEPDFCAYRSLLATGAILFQRGDFKLKAGALDDQTRWLVGPKADERYRGLNAKKTRLPPRQSFPEGGVYVLGCEFDTPSEIRLVADAGPLGYTAIAAHGHADALSFTLSAGGEALFIDPGTYAYHTQGAWREYFRGTAAHNTLRVDGEDQSVQGGNFLWLEKANAGCSLWLSSAERDAFEGWHDGYTRLPDPVKHRRLISLDKAARRIVIEDTLEMAEDHLVELFFHCAEACSVTAAPGGYVVSRDTVSAKLVLPPSGEAAVHKGELSPILGWVSPAFDRRSPTSTIAWRARLVGRTQLRTEIQLSP